MANIWDDQEPFRDSPVEFKAGGWQESDTYTPAPENTLRRNNVQQPKVEVMDEEYVEELTEQVAQEDDEEDYADVLSDARLRLEQGRLYEMVIQHSLFENMDADPRAIKIVQAQIRKFARRQMEIMLGIVQEETVQNPGFISSPFNDLEVTILKKLASAATKGATESEEANTSPQQMAPIAAPKKKATLNSIGASKPKPQPQAQPSRPIQKKAEPIKREAKPKPEINSQGLLTSKSLAEMTAEEKQEKIRQNIENQKGKIAIPENRAPMPDYGTMEMLAANQVNRAVGQATKGNLSALIVANLKGSGKI